MNWLDLIGDLPELEPLLPDIEKAIATAQRIQNDPEVNQAIATVQRLMADQDVKNSLDTFKKVVAIIQQKKSDAVSKMSQATTK